MCDFCLADDAMESGQPTRKEVVIEGTIWDTWWVPEALYYKARAHAEREEYEEALLSLERFLERFENHKLSEDVNKLKTELEAKLGVDTISRDSGSGGEANVLQEVLSASP